MTIRGLHLEGHGRFIITTSRFHVGLRPSTRKNRSRKS
ncbi:hypothetical protein LINPERHAP2_LOCUS16724 [Linum perenne]